MNASAEQKAMCTIVKAIGKGKLYTVKMYLLKRMTDALSIIQSPTYEYTSKAFRTSEYLTIISCSDHTLLWGSFSECNKSFSQQTEPVKSQTNF